MRWWQTRGRSLVQAVVPGRRAGESASKSERHRRAANPSIPPERHCEAGALVGAARLEMRRSSFFIALSNDCGPECRDVAESDEQLSEESGEMSPLWIVETPNSGGLNLHDSGEGVGRDFLSERCESNENSPAVAGVGPPLDQSGFLQPVETHRHATCGDQLGFGEL